MGIGDKGSIVCDRNLLHRSAFHPICDFPGIQHAAAAVNDESIGRKILWKFCTTAGFDLQLPAGVLVQPARDFYGADIIALAVVCTAFGNEDGIAILKLVNGVHTMNCLRQKALVTGHEDGEGGQQDICHTMHPDACDVTLGPHLSHVCPAGLLRLAVKEPGQLRK